MMYTAAALTLLLGAVSANPVAFADPDAAAYNGSSIEKRATTFWYANMDHTGSARGYAPDLDNDYSYPVFQAVAAGNGAGIQSAINSGSTGNRHPLWLASQPRVVYLPPGTYTVSSTILFNTDTIIMGDATNPPTIKAASGFNGNALVDGRDPGTNGSGELSFAVGLKNVILDTTAISATSSFVALEWGVAQAAQLQNVKITMPSSSNGQGHTGIHLTRGSTLGLADVRIEHGQHGIWHDGHQQALYKSIYFYQNTIGFRIDGGSTVSILNPTFDTCGNGVYHTSTSSSPWISLVDATSKNSGVTFKTAGYPSFTIENLSKDTTSNVAEGPNGVLLGSATHVDSYTYGNTVNRSPTYGDTSASSNRPAAIAPGGRYPAIPAPNYATNPVTDFINVKDATQNGGYKVLGDQTIDEAPALNKILAAAAAANKIVYFPFGKYRVDSTLLIPKGSRIVGEAWATITGNGAFFADATNPKPVVAVGNGGDVGVAQIQDMRFSVSQVLPGAIIIQFNIAGNNPGDVALWNSLVTVGGTRGASSLTNTCTNAGAECKAAFLGIHLAKTSSAYIENVWNWVADHTSEDFSGGSNIAAKGGVLVEATKGTWLHALGSEHWWLYQLNLRQASNVLVSFFQSETNYDQGDHTQQIPPAPWTADVTNWGDPDFSWCGGGDSRCRMGFATYINGGSGIRIYGTASWAFFSGPGYQGCAGAFACQNYIHWIQSQPSNTQLYGLCAKDSWAALHLADGTNILSQSGYTGGWGGGGSDVARYAVA